MSRSTPAVRGGGRALGDLVRRAPVLLELFVAANLGFLVADIVLAHSINAFRHWAEWIPLVYSAAGALLLGVPLLVSRRDPREGWPRSVGFVVGWVGIAVGLAGMVWHLDSSFFEQVTLRSLVYSAPFVAPLAYAGLGLLLLMNRTVPHRRAEWSRWVLVLALAGLMGNFGLALADHAQNGFFNPLEWTSVGVSAVGVTAVAGLLLVRPTRGYIAFAWGVLALQAAAGVVGFALHAAPLLSPSSADLPERVLYGPPLFAPLLFANLALLAALGLWDLQRRPDVVHPGATDRTPAVDEVPGIGSPG